MLIIKWFLGKNVAPSLQATAKTLEKQFLQDHIQSLLETRPDVDQLVSNNITDGTEFDCLLYRD